MRLNPFDPDSINVRRGGGGFPGGGGGQLGCGAIVIALIGALVFGIDPGQMLGTMQDVQQGSPTQPGQTGESAAEICDDNAYAMESCNALSSLNQTWQPIFQQAGIEFRQPYLTFYSGGTGSACGSAAAPAAAAKPAARNATFSSCRSIPSGPIGCPLMATPRTRRRIFRRSPSAPCCSSEPFAIKRSVPPRATH